MVFSTYQVYGAYAHLNQNQNKEVAQSLIESAGPVLPRAWDPLRLAIPYAYLSARLFKPPDCSLARLLTILLLLGLYSVPLGRGALYLSSMRICNLLGASAVSVLSRIVLTTTPRSRAGNTPVSFDSDGIPFIINNCTTCIIYCNLRMIGSRQFKLLSCESDMQGRSASNLAMTAMPPTCMKFLRQSTILPLNSI